MSTPKTLVIYYSLSGNTASIANKIREYTGADTLPLYTVDSKVKPQSAMKFLWGGSQVFMKKKPELKPYTLDLEAYDTIIIGTPIWASRHVPAIYAFLDREHIVGKRIAMYCCHAGGGNGKAFRKMEEQLEGNQFIGQIEFRDPKSKDTQDAMNRLEEWLKTLEVQLRF